MKKIYLLSLFALSGVFVLASCGDDTKTDDTGNPSTDDGGKGTDNGGTTDVNGVKVYAAPNDTYPVFLMTYVKDSKLDSFVYSKGSEPIFCQVVYKNNAPDEVKVCSFNSFFGINTTKSKLDGSPIYYTNISSNIFYMVPAYSYAEYKDNVINVKEAGLDAYKIKLTGEVESTYFKEVTKNGLKVGFYDNKFENNKLVSSNYEGKAEMTFDGSKVVVNNFISRGSKYSDYGTTTYEVKDTTAEVKTTRANPFYSSPIDYSSTKATIDSNYVTTSVLSKTYTKSIPEAENYLLLETPIENSRTCTVPEANKYKMNYTDDSYATEAEFTYENGKVTSYSLTGVDYGNIIYDYVNNNEVTVNITGQSANEKNKLVYKYNVMGQITEYNNYDATDTLNQSTVVEYNDKFAITKSTNISGTNKMEQAHTYNDTFTQQTTVQTIYSGENITYKSKNVSTIGDTCTYDNYTYDNDTEIKSQTRTQSYDSNNVATTISKVYAADGSVKSTNTTKVYYDSNLVLTKTETYSNENLSNKTEYTYTNGKLTTIKETTSSQVKTKEFVFNGNVVTSITIITESTENPNDKNKIVYTYSNNYADMDTTQYKWDTATQDFIPANQS